MQWFRIRQKHQLCHTYTAANSNSTQYYKLKCSLLAFYYATGFKRDETPRSMLVFATKALALLLLIGLSVYRFRLCCVFDS